MARGSVSVVIFCWSNSRNLFAVHEELTSPSTGCSIERSELDGEEDELSSVTVGSTTSEVEVEANDKAETRDPKSSVQTCG